MASAYSNLKVLIVDDQVTMLRIIRTMLTQVGFQHITQCTSGEQALEALETGKFDIIFSDWNMTPVTGIELLRAVRAKPELKSLPFIMVTGESKKENIVTAIEAGVSNYIIKPFNVDTLKAKLERVIKA